LDFAALRVGIGRVTPDKKEDKKERRYKRKESE
jgi:hypothetical protein